MIELKSIDKSEQRSVNILSQFWIESDNRSSQRYWILKLIYQNYTTSTLYYYICLPSSDIQLDIHTTWLPLLGIKPCSFSTSITILLIGHWKSLMLLFNVSITFSWTLRTVPCKLGSVLKIHAIGHLFLLVSSFSNATSPTWKFLLLIFHFCCAWRFWRNSFHQRDQNSLAICCTRLHHLHEYRSGLLNTPGSGIITSLFMVRRFFLLFFLIGVHSMRGWTTTTRHGVTRKQAKKITGYIKSV